MDGVQALRVDVGDTDRRNPAVAKTRLVHHDDGVTNPSIAIHGDLL
jgi:hypothetical protein